MNHIDDVTTEDYGDDAVKRLIQRAADSVAVGPAAPFSATSSTSMSARRRPIVALAAAAAAVLVAVIVLNSPWNDRRAPVQDVTGNNPASAPPTTAPTHLPALGRITTVDNSGMEGVSLPRVALPDVPDMLEGQWSRTATTGSFAAPIQLNFTEWNFTPPPGWTGASALSGGTSLFPTGLVISPTGFAESEDGRRSVAAFDSTHLADATFVPDPDAGEVVLARDGSPWSIRSLDVDGQAVVALGDRTRVGDMMSQMSLMFIGLTRAEWTSFLSSTESSTTESSPEATDPNTAPPDESRTAPFDRLFHGSVKPELKPGRLIVPGLPADLRDRWLTTRPILTTSRLVGPGGRTYDIDVIRNASPEDMTQRTMTARQAAMVAQISQSEAMSRFWLPEEGVPFLETTCDASAGTVVCGRITRSPDGDRVIDSAFLSVWRDGSRIDVTAVVDPSAPPDTATSLLAEMGQVIEGLHPAA